MKGSGHLDWGRVASRCGHRARGRGPAGWGGGAAAHRAPSTASAATLA